MKIAIFGFRLFGINTYVVHDPATRKAAIIDPGMIDDEERKALADYIDREKLQVEHLINTHLHVDHAIGDSFVTARYDVRPEAHPADGRLGSDLSGQLQEFGIPRAVEGVKIATELHDGDRIRIGRGELEVIHTPGHSPGGICLYSSEDGFLISGDSLFRGSVGRTDLPGGNTESLIRAIKTRLLQLPDDTVVYPGHGDPTTIGAERRANPYLQ